MTSFQKLLWLSLLGSGFTQGSTSFVEFLAPPGGEVLAVGTSYVLKWAAKSSIGRGTMTLLGGQTSESLSEVEEIASSIDVAWGNFSWPVEVPVHIPRHYIYGLNFSLDGSEGIFSISPLFTIGGAGGDDEDEDDGDADANGDGTTDSPNDPLGTLTPSPEGPQSSRSTSNVISTMTAHITVPAGEVPKSSNGDEDATHKSNSRSSSNTATPVPSQVSGPRTGKGVIAGIVVGTTAALIAFGSLIGLVLYYRRRLLGKGKSSSPEGNRTSKIDGRFRKAELDAEGPQITITRVYELDATREIQEADGNMEPAELDSTVPGSD
ncbi:hypothetical protein F4801DRAFT_529236 [Xylaria longipes]|nr:hypothetical protein F4801DRAFT_529236 [Xylaria longipes]